MIDSTFKYTTAFPHTFLFTVCDHLYVPFDSFKLLCLKCRC